MTHRVDELRASTLTCPAFTLAGEVRYAKIVSCYDGDTARANLFLRDTDPSPVQMAIRFTGYDTAEMKSKKPEEREKAIRARDAVRALCLDRLVRLEIEGLDKYGRVLALVYVRCATTREELCVNTWMVQQGLGVPYAGGTKTDVMVGGDGHLVTPVPTTVDILG